jgi:hypothetical protein
MGHLAAEREFNQPVPGRELSQLEQAQIEAIVRNSLHSQGPAVKFRWQPLRLAPMDKQGVPLKGSYPYCAYAGSIPFYVTLVWRKDNLVSIFDCIVGDGPERAFIIHLCTSIGYRL